MGIFKNHQLEFGIERTQRSVPLDDIFEIRDKGLAFFIEMGIPVILFEICLSLQEEICGLKNRRIQLPVVLVKRFRKTFNCHTFAGPVWSGEKQVGKGFRSGKVCEVVDYWFLP